MIETRRTYNDLIWRQTMARVFKVKMKVPASLRETGLVASEGP